MQVFVLFIDIHYTDNNRTFDVAPCELTPAPKPITAADLAEALGCEHARRQPAASNSAASFGGSALRTRFNNIDS